MKKTITVIIILLQISMLTAQNETRELTQEQTMLVVKKLIELDEQYDKGAPESVKKAKFNEYVDQLNPNLSQADRNKAYDIVNVYISGSKGQKTDISLSEKQSEEIRQMLQNATQKKDAGMQVLEAKMAELKVMSYAEYKDYVTQNGQISLPETDIQKSYNQLHKDDGKQVKVTSEKPSNKIDNPIIAMDIIQNPDKHTYKEFQAAIKFLKPDVTDDEVKKLWQQKNN